MRFLHPLLLCASLWYGVDGFRMSLVSRSKFVGLVAAPFVLNGSLFCGEEAVAEEGGAVRRQQCKVHLEGDISAASCNALRQALQEAALESLAVQISYSLSAPPPIELHIQSTGGSFMASLAAIDAIKGSKVPVHSYIEGYAASAATLLSVVCAKRYAHSNSVMLIHQLSAGASGKMTAMGEEMENLSLFSSIIKSTYLEHTRISEADIDEILKHDIWFSANKCLRLGIIDEII